MITWALVRAFVRTFWPWILALACALALFAYLQHVRAVEFERGAASVRAEWDAANQAAAVDHAVKVGFSDAIGKRTRETAIAIQTETRADTAAALERIEDALEEFGDDLSRRGCPLDIPASVRAEGRKAAAAARAAGREVRQSEPAANGAAGVAR